MESLLSLDYVRGSGGNNGTTYKATSIDGYISELIPEVSNRDSQVSLAAQIS
jgi:hypothetical protein